LQWQWQRIEPSPKLQSRFSRMQSVRASVHGGTQAHGQPTGVRPHALWIAEAFSCPWVRSMEVALGNGRRSYLGADVIGNEKRTVDMGWCSPQMGWVEQTWGCGCTEKVVPMQEPWTSHCSRQPVLVCLKDLRNHERVRLCRRHDNWCSCWPGWKNDTTSLLSRVGSAFLLSLAVLLAREDQLGAQAR
jgi:hypothetical protein